MRTKIGLAGIVLSVGTMMGFNIAGKFSLALFIVMPLVCSAFIAAGWIVHHIADDGEDEHGPDGLARSGGEPVTAERRLPASGVPEIGCSAPCARGQMSLGELT